MNAISLIPRTFIFISCRLASGHGAVPAADAGWPRAERSSIRRALGVVAAVWSMLAGGLSAQASILTTLADFPLVGPSRPMAGLLEGTDGNFYGTALNGNGGIYKVTPGGVFSYVAYHDGWARGNAPHGGLIQGRDGHLYGTTVHGGVDYYGLIFKVTTAGSLSALDYFRGFRQDGMHPYAALLQGSDGNFYGTTASGGTGSGGTVFKVTPQGARTNLVNFSGANGKAPYSGIIEGGDGNFYGVTYEGGNSGAGTVYRMSAAGVLTTLVHFTGANGKGPIGSLVRGRDGNFYGTTNIGGLHDAGTVFRLTPAGVLTTLVHFNGANGKYPYAGLVQGADGGFYGTTIEGGSHNHGVVFKVSAIGVPSTVFNFNGSNGKFPRGALIQGRDGLLYGTTERGGKNGNGTVFKVARPLVDDMGPPSASFQAPQGGRLLTSASSYVLRAAVTDDVSPVLLQFRTQAPSRFAFGEWQDGVLSGAGREKLWTRTLELPENGVWTVQVRAFDAVGNTSLVQTAQIQVDRTAPTLTVRSPRWASSVTRGRRVSLQVSARDDVRLARLEFRIKGPNARALGSWRSANLAGGAWESKAWSRTIALSRRGGWVVQVRAFDAVGNVSATQTLRIRRR